MDYSVSKWWRSKHREISIHSCSFLHQDKVEREDDLEEKLVLDPEREHQTLNLVNAKPNPEAQVIEMFTLAIDRLADPPPPSAGVFSTRLLIWLLQINTRATAIRAVKKLMTSCSLIRYKIRHTNLGASNDDRCILHCSVCVLETTHTPKWIYGQFG